MRGRADLPQASWVVLLQAALLAERQYAATRLAAPATGRTRQAAATPMSLGQRLSDRLARDMVGHDAGQKAPAFDDDESDSLEKLGQLTRRVEVPYGIG